MHRPVCVKCQTELRCEKNEVVVLDMFGPNEEIYKGFYADLFQCPGCGMQIVVGFGQNAFTEHFEEDHAEKLAIIERHTKPEHIIRNFERAKVPA